MSDPTTATSRPRTWAALAICAAALLYPFPYHPDINNPNENVRHFMTAAVVEHGTYQIDRIRDRWDWVNDAAVYEGHIYSVKAPGTSLLAAPGYALYYAGCRLFGVDVDRTTSLWVCRMTASIAPILLFLFFFHRFLGRFTSQPVLRDATLIAAALGSLFYGYSLLFVSHSTAGAAAFGAFMLLCGARRSPPSRRDAYLVGLLAGAVTLFEYPGIVMSVPLAVWGLVVLPWRLRPWLVLGGLLPALAVMHFQWTAFDNPFTPGHLYMESAGFRDAHHQGLYGADAFHPEAAFGLLFSPGSGLFPLTPLFAFALVGLPIAVARPATRSAGIVATACVVLTYLTICFMNNWRGGWTIGPRHICHVVPFVAWGAVIGLDALSKRMRRVTALVAVGTTATGLVASGLPSAYYPHLPPELTRPIGQLFGTLLSHDYAPYNAGSFLGWTGTAAMVPLFALFAGSLAWAVAGTRFALRDRASILVGALFVGGVLVGPHLQSGADDPAVARAVAFVTTRWSPKGDDVAARRERELAGATNARPEQYRELADIYFAEGRDREARATIRRGDLAAQRSRILEAREPRYH